MKTFKIFSFFAILMAFSHISFSQTTSTTTTETIPVSGNCEMCKKHIEGAAKKAGASAATWSIEKKELTVTYNTSFTNAAKIQQAVASVGYDTRDIKAVDAAYKKLDACCRYKRTTTP